MGAATTEGNVAVVRGFLDLVLEGKLDEACGLLSDDYVIREPRALPYGGDYHGPAGFRDLVMRLIAVVEPAQIGEAELRDAGEYVVVHAPSRFTSQASRESVEMDVVELYYVRDGKIVETDVYYKDPEAVARLGSAVPEA